MLIMNPRLSKLVSAEEKWKLTDVVYGASSSGHDDMSWQTRWSSGVFEARARVKYGKGQQWRRGGVQRERAMGGGAKRGFVNFMKW